MVNGRHSATRPSRAAALAAVLVVALVMISLAVGGWVILGRGGSPDTGTAAGVALAARTDTAPLAALASKPPAAVAATPATSYGSEVTRLTNLKRARAGCGALRVEPELQTAAQLHSKDMVDRKYFSHTSPEGTGPGDRAAAQGYRGWSGENIAAGYPTPAAVVRAWMSSAGHRANILNCRSTSTGVGYDARARMWTQLFGFV